MLSFLTLLIFWASFFWDSPKYLACIRTKKRRVRGEKREKNEGLKKKSIRRIEERALTQSRPFWRLNFSLRIVFCFLTYSFLCKFGTIRNDLSCLVRELPLHPLFFFSIFSLAKWALPSFFPWDSENTWTFIQHRDLWLVEILLPAFCVRIKD